MASSTANQPLAIVHGRLFPDSVDFPSSLVTALVYAAKTNAGIRYIEADGTETVQSYAALLETAKQVATALQARGLGNRFNSRPNSGPGNSIGDSVSTGAEAVGEDSLAAQKRQTDFVILQFTKSVDLITALWGCFLSGCVPVPLSIGADQASRQTLLEGAIALLETPTLLTDLPLADSSRSAHSLPVTVLTLDELQSTAPTVEQSSSEPQPNDTALLLLTSGSTGMPKGVQLTHQNIRVSAYGMSTVNQLFGEDTTLNWMPLEHVASLVMFHLTEVYIGCEQIHVAREIVLKDPLAWLDLLERYQVSASWAPNFAYGLVNDQLEKIEETAQNRAWDLSSIRWMGNGAEAVVGKTARQFLQLLTPYRLSPTALSPGYGMTETCSGIVHSQQFSLNTTTDADTFVTLGQPIPGVSLRITDVSDQIVPEEEIGRLQVKGLTVMAGYIANPGVDRHTDLNADRDAVFTTDGWFNTGDLAFIRAGNLTITGRQKDTIILNGVNYYSHEIESVVEALADVEVSFTAACGVRSAEDTTEQLAIFFHPVRGIAQEIGSDAEDLDALLLVIKQIRNCVIEKIGISPTYVLPVEKSDIPKTSIGKVQRSQLSRRFVLGEFDSQVDRFVRAFQASSAAKHLSQAELERRIASIWQSVLSVDAVGKDDNFFELGGTSLRLMQVLGQLQNQLSPTLKAVSLFQYPTITALAAHLNQADSEASSLELRESLRAKLRQQSNAQPLDIAVVGMAGRFPGAANLDAFWRNLKGGTESITFFTDEEMLAAGIDPALIQYSNYVNASPVLEAVDRFDADFFGYSPKEARLMDPQQRLLLECAWEGLETAGYDPLTYEGEIGLFAGATMNTYLLNNVYPNRHTLDQNDSLEPFTLSSFGGFQATVANDKDYLTTRVSYKLNLRGPSLNVQTACSTSLVSIHLAAQSLLQGECDMALAGGVSVEVPQQAGYLYQEGMILSDDGHCRAFDANSKGTLFGSGVGLVVLKRLDEAIAHKDFIYAIIKGSAIGNDGGQKVGYLAPLSEGQTRVAAEAMAIANTPAETIGYVEAHGTGTQLGDPIEIAALTNAFRRSPNGLSTNKKQFCPIGSVKTNVGHLNIASGVVGFIKAALAVHHGQIPASLHFQTPNPQIDFASSPFYVNTALTDWPTDKTPRRAGINSLGIGGTNVHMVVEEAQIDRELYRTEGGELGGETAPEIFVLSAKSESALKALVEKYVEFFADCSDAEISDVCFTLGVGRSHFSYRLSLVVNSVTDLHAQLQDWLANSDTDSHTNAAAKTAFLFTGQGAQFVGMGKMLYESQPSFRDQIDRCAEILRQYDFDLLNVLSGEDGELTNELINQTQYTQPSLFAFEYAIAHLWMSWGIRPNVVIGHSLGEYVAACIAGVFSLEEALRLVVARGRLIQALPAGGKMLSVMADVATCEQFLEQGGEGVAIAAINSPKNTVLSGSDTAIDSVAQQLAEQEINCKPLKVSHAFHSPLMEPMLSDFRTVAASIDYQPPSLEIISNLTGEIVNSFSADYWVRHVQQPVRFAEGVKTLQKRGITTFLECGPRPVLLTLAQATIDADSPAPDSPDSYRYLASLHPKQSDDFQMLTSLSALYQGGYQINWNAFYRHHRGRRIPLPTYAFQRQRYWMDRPAQSAMQRLDKNAHPLVGQKVDTPLRQTLFQQTISSAQPEFLQHHRVRGQILVSGSAFLDIALSAGAEVLQADSIQLEQVSILQPLPLSDRPVKVQTVLTPKSDNYRDDYRFEIYSRREDDSNWTLHCEGIVRAVAKIDSRFVEIEQIKDRLGEVRSPEAHYDNCDHALLSYSGPFRCVQKVWYTTDEALGKIRLAESRDSRYQLHPAVLDGCFQCVLAALPSNHETYVPIGVERVCLHSSIPVDSRFVWSHVQLSPAKGDAVTVTADVQILSADGRLIASVAGLAAKQISLGRERQSRQWENWLYEVKWQLVPAVGASDFIAGDNWLIVADDVKQLEASTHQLTTHEQICTKVLFVEDKGHGAQKGQQTKDCIEINHAAHRKLISCLKNNKWKGVLYIASSNVEQSCKSALVLTQALVSCGLSTRLWLITHSAQAVLSSESLNIWQSPLWGMGKTIALEHPELNCVCLDLERDNEQQMANLMAELSYEHSTENQIAYRGGDRYVARLVQHLQNPSEDVPPAANLQLQIAEKGTLEQLEWKECDRRQPGPDEIELKVLATGLNFRDVLNALDLYPGEAGPLGLECAGEVVGVGMDVETISAGDRVMAIAPASFSQFVTVPAALAVSKPNTLSAVEAATVPTAFLTAYYTLVHLGKLRAGDRVLIHAAAGGVGQAAVQIAQMIGAEVFATASKQKWEFLRQQGVAHIFNSRTSEFGEQIMQQTARQGVDVVLNSLSGNAIAKSLSTLAANGRFLEIGKAGIWSTDQVRQQRPDVSYEVVDLVKVTKTQPQLIQSMLNKVVSHLQTDLSPLPHQVYLASQATEAFRSMQQAKHIGKVVVTPPASTKLRAAGAPIRAEATYLVTGGAGALGLQLSRWLVDQGATSLVLLVRSKPSDEVQAKIDQLSGSNADGSNVSIKTLQSNLLDQQQLQSDLACTLKSAKKPLKGVFHLAGEIDDGLLPNQSWQTFTPVLSAKVSGTWNLHRATQAVDLDHFVMFSSVASLLGSAGQVNYAAANSFLDAIAHYRHQQRLPALSINWTAWAGVGLAERPEVKQRFSRTDIPLLDSEYGFDILARLLESNAAVQVGVLPGNIESWQRMSSQSLFLTAVESTAFRPTESSIERQPGLEAQRSPSQHSQSKVRLAIQTALEEGNLAVLSEHIQDQLAVVLGKDFLEKDSVLIDDEASFTELGLDSLTAVEFRNRLQTSLSCVLPVTLVYEYPTLTKLRDHIVDLLMSQPKTNSNLTKSDPDERDTDKSDRTPPTENLLEDSLENISDDEAQSLLLQELNKLDQA